VGSSYLFKENLCLPAFLTGCRGESGEAPCAVGFATLGRAEESIERRANPRRKTSSGCRRLTAISYSKASQTPKGVRARRE
jgi:hypothetical protein